MIKLNIRYLKISLFVSILCFLDIVRLLQQRCKLIILKNGRSNKQDEYLNELR